MSVDLTFREVGEANRVRCVKWHDADSEPWTGADWGNAMGGECGEAQNVVKICHILVEPLSDIEIDHVIPLSKGGTHTYDNVAVSHSKCNRKKSACLPSS